MIEQARILRDLGAPYREIAEELGVDNKTVRLWTNPRTYVRHLELNREARKRGRLVPGTRVTVATAGRMETMRREYNMSYAAIAGAVLTHEPDRYQKMSGGTVRKVLAKVAPDLPVRLHGAPFQPARDRLKAAA